MWCGSITCASLSTTRAPAFMAARLEALTSRSAPAIKRDTGGALEVAHVLDDVGIVAVSGEATPHGPHELLGRGPDWRGNADVGGEAQGHVEVLAVVAHGEVERAPPTGPEQVVRPRAHAQDLPDLPGVEPGLGADQQGLHLDDHLRLVGQVEQRLHGVA